MRRARGGARPTDSVVLTTSHLTAPHPRSYCPWLIRLTRNLQEWDRDLPATGDKIALPTDSPVAWAEASVLGAPSRSQWRLRAHLDEDVAASAAAAPVRSTQPVLTRPVPRRFGSRRRIDQPMRGRSCDHRVAVHPLPRGR